MEIFSSSKLRFNALYINMKQLTGLGVITISDYIVLKPGSLPAADQAKRSGGGAQIVAGGAQPEAGG